VSADAIARDHLWVSVPLVSRTASAGEARTAAAAHPNGGILYVVGERGELAGTLPVVRLFELDAQAPIAPELEPPGPTVDETQDQEHVALIAIRHGLAEVPVVDAERRFVGVVPASALVAILHHEHVEDLDRLSGVLRQTEHAVRALEEPPTRRVRERLPWLLVGLLGSAIATAVVAGFEDSLRQHVAVAFFMPAIVYLADAIGTQTEAIAVRGLSFRHASAQRLFFDEMRTGSLLGLALALPSLPAIWWFFGSWRLGIAVAAAILIAGTVATGVGLGFPLVLAKLGKDPALGSGPLATVVQDVLSLVTYLVVAHYIL
jgi:magnesium transporter